MQIRKKIYSLLVLLLLVLVAQAQVTKLRGKISDSQSGEPLPFVNVSFPGTTIGTVTDFDGNFFLETRTPGDSLSVSYLGYFPQRVAVRKGAFQELNFALEPESFSLEAVVVKPGENPAHKILRSIIRNKSRNNTDNLESYSYESYNKIEVDLNNVDDNMKNKKIFKQFQFIFDYVDTNAVTGKAYLPIFISEAISDYYFQRRPKVEREVIKATKISGVKNESVAQFTGKIYQKVNVYDNYINVFDQGLVSPIADAGLLYYKYYLIDSAYIGNKWCYQVSFKPRRRQEPTFTGDFWVNDTTWAIVKTQVRIAADVNINFVNDLVATAEYKLVNDTLWFPDKLTLFVDFNLTDKTTGFFGHKTTVYNNVKVNIPLPQSLEAVNEPVVVRDSAMQKSTDYWQTARPFELTEKEAGIYSMVDSVQQVPMYKTFIDIVNMFVNYYYVVGKFEIGPYYKTYSFNEIEGNRFRISGRTSNAFSTRLMLSGFAAYGDKDNRFKYGLGALYMVNKSPREAVSINYKSDIEQLGQSPNALTEDNILTSVLRRNPNYKLSLVKELNLSYHKEWVTGFSNSVTFNHKVVFPTEYIPFTQVPDGAALPRITNAMLTVNTRWQKDERFVAGEFERVSLGSPYPELNFNVSGGLRGVLDSDYDFLKLHFNYYHKFNINPFGYARFIVDAGKIFGKVPYPMLQLHEGNETYAFDRFAFNMMNYYEFASDQYVSVFFEHHFQGFFLNRIPLMRRLKWREVAAGKFLVGSISEENKNVLEFPLGLNEVSEPYGEVSVGVENIFKVFRVDAMWRLSHLDNPNIEKFGVRVGLQIIF
ncbi:MAG: carboxypeptidase-like regulatory domain-containing protein [Bacteroidales bacterium]|nr:carboxypeptidase-like regulatory domain-containing protein [Bacteroidales bacterium]MBN2749799.1 carboxypeptidase-like regulatory domain-containing protein [Bacteroidales bacterium]